MDAHAAVSIRRQSLEFSFARLNFIRNSPSEIFRKPMSKTFDIAVVGATGIAGEALLDQLAARRFPIGTLYALGNEDAVGERVQYGEGSIRVADIAGFDYSLVQLVFLAPDESDRADIIPRAIEAGCYVIDVTSQAGFETDLPPVLAGVNEHAIASCIAQRYFRNPSCASMLIWPVLKPIYDLFGIDRVDVTILQAVSGRGRQGLEELASQTANLLNAKPIEIATFPAQIAFNAISYAEVEQDSEFSADEMRIMSEARILLGDAAVIVNPIFLTIPVFYGDCLVCTLILRDPGELEEVIQAWNRNKEVKFQPVSADTFPTPVSTAGSAKIHICRVRQDPVDPRGLSLALVGDCSRAGMARNSVQIAEILVKDYL
jgi:aspartate-semialdehyde dehydrogenase